MHASRLVQNNTFRSCVRDDAAQCDEAGRDGCNNNTELACRGRGGARDGHEQNQPAAAITALTAKAKLSGQWVERSEQTTKTDDLSTLSDAQLAAIIKGDQPEKTQH